MAKKEIIEKIKEMLNQNETCFYSFIDKMYPFHYDSSKYDLMGVYLTENNGVEVECVGYSGFKLNYFDAEKLSYKTLNMIMSKILFDEDYYA